MSFFSVLFDRVKSESAIDYTQFYVDAEEPQHVLANTQYVRVWLRSARIVDVRRWTKKFHATVHGQFAYVDRLRGRQEVLSVVAPAKAFEEMDPGNLDRFITVNRPLLGPVPYAGELTMDVALFSVAAEDLAKPYLDLLATLTDTASVSFLGQVKPFVEPLRRGAETLLGDADRAQLEIGLSRTDTQLQVGNIVVARVAKGTVKPADLRIDPRDYRLVDPAGQPITAFPYMVIGVEATAQRDDYASIPEIQSGWGAVRQAALEGRPVEEVRGRFDQLRRAVWLSPDLIQTDKKRIVESFNREISDAGYDLAPPHELATARGHAQNTAAARCGTGVGGDERAADGSRRGSPRGHGRAGAHLHGATPGTDGGPKHPRVRAQALFRRAIRIPRAPSPHPLSPTRLGSRSPRLATHSKAP